MAQFCYRTLFLFILQQIVRKDMDSNLKKLANLHKVLIPCLQKHQKTLLWLALLDEICLISSS